MDFDWFWILVGIAFRIGLVAVPIILVIWAIAQFLDLKSAANDGKSTSSQRRYDPVSRRVSEVSRFSDSVTSVYARNAQASHRTLAELGNEYSKSVNQLKAVGDLTPRVEEELERYANRSAKAVTDLTKSFGESLDPLIRSYDGRKRRR